MKTYTLTEDQFVYVPVGDKDYCDPDMFVRGLGKWIKAVPLSSLLQSEEEGIKGDDYVPTDKDFRNFLLWLGEQEDFKWDGEFWNENTGHDDFEQILMVDMYDYWKDKIHVPSDNNNEGASLASHFCTIGNSIEQFRDQLLTIIYSNQEAMKRAKANKMPVMEIFETTNIYDAIINEYEDLFSIVTNLPLKFPDGHSEMIDMLNSDKNDERNASQQQPNQGDDLSNQIKISELREKFFKECVDNVEIWKMGDKAPSIMPKVNLAPHNLFEWFKPYLRDY